MGPFRILRIAQTAYGHLKANFSEGEETMQIDWILARYGVLALGLTFSTAATAGSVNFQIAFTGHVDCYRPIAMNNIPISGSGTGTMNTDGSASADLTETAFILSTQIHFEGRLGRATAAPGGTAQVRVAGQHRLLLIWNLPNNQFVVTVNVTGQTCNASFAANLKPGQSEYSLYDGNIYHYCGRPVPVSASCQVH